MHKEILFIRACDSTWVACVLFKGPLPQLSANQYTASGTTPIQNGATMNANIT